MSLKYEPASEPLHISPPSHPAAAERGGHNCNGFEDFHLKKGSSEGQNLALAVLCVPYSLDGGLDTGFLTRDTVVFPEWTAQEMLTMNLVEMCSEGGVLHIVSKNAMHIVKPPCILYLKMAI